MLWIIRPWRRALDVSGRATRREFWLFHLQIFVVIFGFAFVSSMARALFHSEVVGAFIAIPELLLVLVMVVAGLSLAIRRLHDHDKSGWFYLLAFVPLIGWIFFLIMMLTPGTPGENSYGYDPRDGDDAPVEDVAAVFS